MKTRRTIWTIVLLLLTLTAKAQNDAQPEREPQAEAERHDPRAQDFIGLPLEGNISHFTALLRQKGFQEWGQADDGEDYYFRGDYYGLRVKLTVTADATTHLVSQVQVVVGPYRTKEMFDRNQKYLLYKLQQDYGRMTVRSGAYFSVGEYGVVKVSDAMTDTGLRELRVFYLNTAPFYKDAAIAGLRGNVQQVVTENPVAEQPMEQYAQDGRIENGELWDRHYDDYGYLTEALMTEPSGENSVVRYEYDSQYRLVRRTLTNQLAGVRYVNEYTYNGNGEVTTQMQKVYDKSGELVVSISMKNSYEAHDEQGNWTQNTMNLIYWEKDAQPQTGLVKQKRTISYWE